MRELENIVRRAIVLKDWNFAFSELSLGKGPGETRNGSTPESPSFHESWSDDQIRIFFRENDFSLKALTKKFVSDSERRTILDTLMETHWNRKEAARLLQVSYKTLLNRIAEFNLSR